jgi:hypothetical protein
MQNRIKNIETRFLINIANNSMFDHAEKRIQIQYKLDKKENIYEQMTLEIVEHIESMIASQPDPNHWSLNGYKSLSEGWRQLEELGTWELRDAAIENGEV